MNVLLITRKYPPSVGGMELFASDLVAALSPKVGLILVKWGGSNKWLPIVYPYLFLVAFWKLVRNDIDVIHIQDGVLGLCGYVLAKIFRKPYVVIIHGLDITYDNAVYNSFFVPAIRRATAVICISQAAKRAAISRGIDDAKIHVITLAVQAPKLPHDSREQLLGLYNLPKNSKILLTVGRLVERKGVAWFISNVLPSLVAKYPQTIYLVVGEGPMRQVIAQAITKNQLNEHVRLLGRISSNNTALAFGGSDVFVMPNINVANDMEGFGLVSLEASMAGLPVVASDTEGIQDAVSDGKNGLLVPVGDSERYFEAISGLYNSSEAKAFGKKSRDFSENNYSWSKISESYVDLYKKLI